MIMEMCARFLFQKMTVLPFGLYLEEDILNTDVNDIKY